MTTSLSTLPSKKQIAAYSIFVLSILKGKDWDWSTHNRYGLTKGNLV